MQNNPLLTEKYKLAEQKMAQLMLSHKEFTDAYPNEVEQAEKLKQAVNSYGKQLASDPFFFDIMIQWMVDVKGNNSEFECNDLNTLTQVVENDTDDLINQQGSLANQVQKVIESNGFQITDRGIGGNRWHVGVPCNEVDSRRLCSLLNQTFKKSLELGAIKIVRHFWEWRLPTLYNSDALDHFLRSN
jgi:hypothetical protein